MITILNQPASPNFASNEVPLTVTSDNTTELEFSFVCDIYDLGGVQRLTRLRKQPNPQNRGVFNLNRILNDYLTYEYQALGRETLTASNFAKTFEIRFGEEFRDNADSALQVRTGTGDVVGEPATAATNLLIYKGIQTVLELDPQLTDTFLTLAPNNQRIHRDDSYTLSYNGTITGAVVTMIQSSGETSPTTGTITPSSQFLVGPVGFDVTWPGPTPPWGVGSRVRFFDEVTGFEATVQFNEDSNTVGITVENGGVAQTTELNYSYGGVSNLAFNLPLTNTAGNVIFIGLGPDQIVASIPSASDSFVNGSGFDRYLVEIMSGTDVLRSLTFDLYHTRGALGETRFVWVNEFGAFDYYTADQAHTTNRSANRRTYDRNRLDTGVVQPSVSERNNANVYRSSRRQYYTTYTEESTVQTGWLDTVQANNLEGLFEAPEAWVQEGSRYVPIIIQNSSWEQRPIQHNEELFNYQITFERAIRKNAR